MSTEPSEGETPGRRCSPGRAETSRDETETLPGPDKAKPPGPEQADSRP
jgi:hypothetical protein